MKSNKLIISELEKDFSQKIFKVKSLINDKIDCIKKEN